MNFIIFQKLLQKIESFLTKQPELSFCWFVAGKIMEEGFEDFERAKEFYERCLSFQGGICGLENPLRAFLHLGRAMEKIGQVCHRIYSTYAENLNLSFYFVFIMVVAINAYQACRRTRN